MDDTISRQAAIETALTFFVEYLGGAFDERSQKLLVERMNEVPFAQPEYMLRIHQDSIEWVRKKSTGRWMHHKTKSGKSWWRCSECGAVTENASAAHYCYNCGADMKGGVDGADGNG